MKKNYIDAEPAHIVTAKEHTPMNGRRIAVVALVSAAALIGVSRIEADDAPGHSTETLVGTDYFQGEVVGYDNQILPDQKGYDLPEVANSDQDK